MRRGEAVVVMLFAVGCAGLPAPSAPGGDAASDDDAPEAAVARTYRVVNAVDLDGRRLAFDVSEGRIVAPGSLGDGVTAHDHRAPGYPLEPMSDETIAAWSDRAVIATLGAFGRSSAIANLARLRAAGCAVLYGTDLGNTRTAGIDELELTLLARAGLDADAIVQAATETPRRVLRLPRHGALGVGDAASYLVYRDDVRADPSRLAHPDEVVLDGVRR